jgi:DNA polymerase-1
MMVVGESPTLGDDQKHKVFTGQRGRMIDEVIRTVVPEARVFYTNIMGCRVVDSKELKDDIITNCMGVMDFEAVFDKVQPKVIVTLGNIVLKALTKRSGITTYRGAELEYKGCLVIPTYSPGAVLRSPKYNVPFKADILKACLTLTDHAQKYAYQYVPVMTRDTLRDALNTLQMMKRTNKLQYLSLDLETTTYDYWRPETKIMTIGFCADGHKCYSIPVDHPQSPWRGQGKTIMNLLRPYFCDPSIPVVGNNWKYDQKWVRAKLGATINFGPDNMLLSYANDENSPHGLKYQADVYCNSGKYDKDLVWPKEFDPVVDNIENKVAEYMSMNLAKLMKYNALDAFYTWHVYPIELERLNQDERTKNIYTHLLEKGSHLFVRVEENGMWVDPDRIKDATAECEYNLTEVKSVLDSLIPEGWCERNLNKKQQKEGFNWNSTKQLGQLFFQEDGFNFPILAKTEKGAPSTAEATIINLDASIEHPALRGLLEYRKWAKYMSTYLRPWAAKLDKNSRLHPNFKLHGTVTGRLSGEDGVHQVPRDKFIRQLIGAPPGWSFLEIDGSQIELRVAAAVAHENTMLRIYATGGDIHKTTAAAVTHKKIEDVTGDDRKKAKAVNFGFLYGMGWKKFKIYSWEKYGIRVSDADAKAFRERFFELYHDLPEWHKKMRRLVRQLGYVVSPIGRKRRLPDIFSSDEGIQAAAEREAINSPVQGFGSDYVLAAAIEMYFKHILPKDPDFKTIRPVGSVHDAIYYEIRNDKIDYWAPIIKATFDDATRLKDWFNYEPPLPITGDIKLGNHWGNAKEWNIGEPYPHEMR